MCCGRSSKQPSPKAVSSQKPITTTSKPVIKALKSISAIPAIKPQKLNKRCYKCSYPTMSVIVAGRERYQCTNPNCRAVQK